MMKIAWLGLLLGLCSCGGVDQAIRKDIELAAIAIKAADANLAEVIPVLSDRIRREVEDSGQCQTDEECLALWDQKMSGVLKAVEGLEAARDALLNFSDLYYRDQNMVSLLDALDKAIRAVSQVVNQLKEAGATVPQELEQAQKYLAQIDAMIRGTP